MGLLDDAIREHLELKRQHGADPSEVERQEREALGEGRRAEFAPAPGEAEETGEQAPYDAAAEEPAAPTDEHEPAAVARYDAAAAEPAEPPADELPAGEPGVPEAPAPGDEGGAPGYDEDPWLAEERDEVPAGESLDRPRPDDEPEQEDVLEETPEFLQETPEHDRLWFEQRPPRDFDWDK